MQVCVAFAEAHVRSRPYLLPTQDSIPHAAFTPPRRTVLRYYPSARMLQIGLRRGAVYRLVDFNASRNTVFQQALSMASGRTLDLDGDLIDVDAAGAANPGQTEAAARSLRRVLKMDDREIRRELKCGDRADFDCNRETPWRDSTTHQVMSPLEFMQRLAELEPRSASRRRCRPCECR
jgi:hypothetical protein